MEMKPGVVIKLTPSQLEKVKEYEGKLGQMYGQRGQAGKKYDDFMEKMDKARKSLHEMNKAIDKEEKIGGELIRAIVLSSEAGKDINFDECDVQIDTESGVITVR